MEEVDDTDAIEVTNEDQCQERTPKKAKVKQTSVLTYSGFEYSGAEIPRSAAGVGAGAELPHSATGVVSGAGPSGPVGDNMLGFLTQESGRRLVRIKETITWEYFFEK